MRVCLRALKEKEREKREKRKEKRKVLKREGMEVTLCGTHKKRALPLLALLSLKRTCRHALWRLTAPRRRCGSSSIARVFPLHDDDGFIVVDHRARRPGVDERLDADDSDDVSENGTDALATPPGRHRVALGGLSFRFLAITFRQILRDVLESRLCGSIDARRGRRRRRRLGESVFLFFLDDVDVDDDD